MSKLDFMKNLGLDKQNSGVSTGTEWLTGNGHLTESVSPADGSVIAHVRTANRKDYETVISQAQKTFPEWRKIPAPQRGEIVRQIGNAVREAKDDLGKLVSWEMGKIYQEGLGEVQEMIDICDFAVGLSRQLYGFTMHSERPGHRMYDQYHPLGIVGIITAFNFPVAVWSWNSMIAAVCGDVSIWKPSPKTPLCSIALQRIIGKVMRENKMPEGVFNLVIGTNEEIAETLVNDTRVPLISATGSTDMGRKVSAISSFVPMTRLNTPSGIPFSRSTLLIMCCNAIEHIGVLGLGFQIETFPQIAAIIAFHDQTATGKLNAVMIPTIPRGWYWSYMR